MTQLYFPLLAMFLLTFLLSGYMLYVRIRDSRNGKMNPAYFKTFDVGIPSLDVVKTQRHYINLFEVPVLYYLVVVLAIIFKIEGTMFLQLAWLFVIARILHMIIHVGPNKLYLRMCAFFGGYAVLAVMWAVLTHHVLTLPS